MTDITKKVVGLLKSYPAKKRRIEQLLYEMGSKQIIDENELIGSMALGAHTESQRYQNGGHLSDRTAAIALHYNNVRIHMEGDIASDIRSELRVLIKDVDRLEYYVSLLGKNEADVIRLLYFEGKHWADTEECLNISERTLFRLRKSAIKELASMYELLQSVGNAENTGS